MTRLFIIKMRRKWGKFGPFELLIIFVLTLYLYYMIQNAVLLHKNSNKISKPALKPLFTIPKRRFQHSAGAQVPRPEEDTKCSVTVAIILCEDDRYVSVINKSLISNKTQVLRPPERGTVAKDFSRQINQTLVLIKSVAILSKYQKPTKSSCTEFLLLADKPSHYKVIKNEIKSRWSTEFQTLVKITNVPVHYPSGSAWMRKMFRPCATLRLFLAELLPITWDSVIYVDTDVIFLQNVDTLWSQFQEFDREKDKNARNVGKVAAMAPCLFHYGSVANSVPYFGESGLNAGIMLMNLTRMRLSQWTNKIRMVTTMFQDKIKLADQDILNIYFHFFPEELNLLSCDWNFRPFQCRKGSYCEDPEIDQGISTLHGNALSFTPHGPEPLFRAVYQTFHLAKLDDKFNLKKFVAQLEAALIKAEEKAHLANSPCKQYGGFEVLVLNRLYGILEE